jgi:TP901 family phage tail tape measure protein
LSGLARVDSAMGSLGKGAAGAAGAMGTAMVAGGALVVGAAAAAAAAGVKLAGDLQQSVANISTIKPDIDTSALFSSLNDMSTRIPQSAAQLGEAMYDVFSSMDVNQAQALQLTEQFAKGAVAAGTDAKTFGTAAMGAMNAYGMSVEDAGKVSDVFFKTVEKGVVTGAQLASGMGPMLGAAKAMGVDYETAMAMAAGATREGGDAAQNLNNMTNLFNKLPTKDATAALKNLGIETATATGELRSPVEVLGELKTRLGGMTEAARALELQKIFPDAQARQGAQVIMSQLDMVNETLESNRTAMGTTEAAYTKMSSTFNSQSQLLGNTVNAMLTTIGAELLPHITPIVTALAQNLPAAFAGLQAAAAPVIAFFQGSVMPVLAGVGEALGKLFTGDTASGMAQLGSIIGGVVAQIGAALPGIMAQLNAWGMAFLNWLAPYVPPMLAALAQVAASIMAWIVGQVPGFMAQLQTWGLAFLAWVPEAVAGILAALTPLASNILSWLTAQAPAFMTNLVTTWLPAIVSGLGQVIAAIGSWLIAEGPGLAAQMNALGAAIMQGLIEGFRQLAQPVVDAAMEGLRGIAAGIVAQGAEWVAAANTATEGVREAVSSGFSAMESAVTSVMAAVSSTISSAWESISSTVSSATAAITAATSAAWSSIQSAAAAAWSAIQSAVSSAWAAIVSTITTAVAQAVAAVQGFAGQVAGALAAAASAAAAGAAAIGQAIVNGVVSGINAGIGAVTAAAANLAQSALNAAKAAIGAQSPSRKFASDVGVPMVEGIIVGIEKTAPDLYRTMTKLAKQTALVAGREFHEVLPTGAIGPYIYPGGRGESSFGGGETPGEFVRRQTGMADALEDVGVQAVETAVVLGDTLDRALLDLVPAADQATAAVQRLAASMRTLPVVSAAPPPAAAPSVGTPGNPAPGQWGGIFAGSTINVNDREDIEVLAWRVSEIQRAY